MIHLNFSSDVVDKDDDFFVLFYPSKLDSFIISKKSKKDLRFNVSAKNAVMIETMSDMTLYYMNVKDSKNWISSFEIWKDVYHPNHVGIHFSYKQDNKMVFVEDKKYVDLLKLISDNKKNGNVFEPKLNFTNEPIKITFNEGFVKIVARSVVKFISHLHSMGIVYGNLSLENIVITSQDNISVTTSFNMSRSKTKTNLVFCAPEVITDEKYSTASDIWNLGVILYILLFGKYPFSLESEEELKNDILQKKISFPNESCVSKRAKEFLVRLFEKDAKERLSATGCLQSNWIRSSFQNPFQYFESGSSLLSVNNNLNLNESLDEKKEFQTIVNQIPKLFEKLKYLKFNKVIKSNFSLVSDAVFQHNLIVKTPKKSRDVNKRLSTVITKIKNIKVLLVGLPNTGKVTFVEKFINHFEAIKKEPQIKYINGSKLTTYQFQMESICFTFHILSFPTSNDMKYFNFFFEKNLKSAGDVFEFRRYGDSGKKDFLESGNLGSSNMTTSSSEDDLLRLSKEVIPKHVKVLGRDSKDIGNRESSPIYSSYNKNVPKYMKVLGIDNSTTPNDQGLQTERAQISFANYKPFKWLEVDWSCEFIDLDKIIYFSDCKNYVDDKTVDDDTLENFKRVIYSKNFYNENSLYTNVPVTIVVNKIDCKPLLAHNQIETQFSSLLPQVIKDFRSKVLFGSSGSESFLKDVYYSLLNEQFTYSKYSEMPNNLKNMCVENYRSLVLKKTNFFRNIEAPLFKLIPTKQISKLELINQKRVFKSKSFGVILSQLKKSSLENLVIAGGVFTKENIDLFCDILQKNEINLRYLRLIDLEIKFLDLIKILKCLVGQQNLICLEISKNRMDGDCLKRLEETLLMNHSISEVYLCDCALNEKILRPFLFRNLRFNDSIKTLDISENQVSPSFLEEIVTILEEDVSINLCNFSFSCNTLDSSLKNRIDNVIANNRKYVTRKNISNKLAKNKFENVEAMKQLLPNNSLSISLLQKIFFELSQRREEFGELYERCKLALECTEESLKDAKMRDEENAILYYFQKKEVQNLFDKIDLSYFLFQNSNIELLNLEELEFKNVKIVNLSGNRLTEIPKNIFTLVNLEILNISNNNVESISDEISKLSCLKILDLSNNHIVKLSNKFSALENLHSLFLHNNHISHIKIGILGSLKNLEIITLHNNFLDTIPQDFFENVSTVKHLTASKNFFHYLKRTCYEMWGNKETKANLSFSDILDLPYEIYLLRELKELDLSNNKLKSLPPHICYLTKLEMLDLRNNSLSELPPQISFIFPNLKELYLHGNNNLNLPRDILLEQNRSIPKDKFSLISEYLENLDKKKCDRKYVNVNLIVDSDEDLSKFVKMISIETSKMTLSNIHSYQELVRYNTIKISESKLELYLQIDQNRISENIEQNKTSEDTVFETLKNLQIPKKESKEKDTWHNDIMLNENLFLKLTSFDDPKVFSHYIGLFSEYYESIFVIITKIENDLSNILSKIQIIRSISKCPVLILGNNHNNYDKKNRKNVEYILSRRISNVYQEISGVLFMTNENNKELHNIFSKMVQSFPKMSYKELQLERLVECESRFLYPFSLIKGTQLELMIDGCKFDKEIPKNLIKEKMHNIGCLVHFSTSTWGKNNVVIVEPRFLVNIIRHLMNYSKGSNGILDIYDCYCQFLVENNILIFSDIWMSIFIYFLKKVGLVFELKLNPSLSHQFKRLPEKMKNEKIPFYLVSYHLKNTTCDWLTLQDMWETFSHKLYLEKNEKKPSVSSEIVTLKNQVHKDEQIEPKEGEKQEEEYVLEKWFQLGAYPDHFFNKILQQVLSFPNLTPIRLWKDLAVCCIGNNLLTLMFGLFTEENTKIFKFVLKGKHSSKYFFIINDIFEVTIKNIFSGSKIPNSCYSVVPISECENEVVMKLDILELSIYTRQDLIECIPCQENYVQHDLIPSKIAKYLTFDHWPQYHLNIQYLKDKKEIGKGSAGIIFKAVLNDSTNPSCIVAIKELNTEYDVEEEFEKISPLINGWRYFF